MDFYFNICDVLCNLLPFVRIKKREKHPWRGVTFSKVAGPYTDSLYTCWDFLISNIIVYW